MTRTWLLAAAAVAVAAVVLVVRVGVGGADSAVPDPIVIDASVDADGWRVVFDDTFSGDSLDPVWSTCHWWQVDGGCTIITNDEQQWYRPEGVAVRNGELQLTATSNEQMTSDGRRLPIRSGMVSTGPRSNESQTSGFEFTYGVVEVRAWLPDGGGTWPAIWLLSADKESLPEIDILERYGNHPELSTSHVHQRVDGRRASARTEVLGLDLDGGWHVFGVDWSAEAVVFSIDGVETGRVTDAELVPTTPMYLIINLAMGGTAGTVDLDVLPQTFRIDEVVVRQQEPAR